MSPRSKAVFLALLPVLLLTPPFLWLGKRFENQLAFEKRTRTQNTLELHAAAVQWSVDRIEGKIESLAQFATNQTAAGRTVDDQSFTTFAAGLHAGSKWIKAFQIVSDGVITHTYPLEGNETALGYNLLTDPRPVIGGDVVRAVKNGRATLTGPIDLVQGGLGIIIRKPLRKTNDGPVRLVAVALNIAPLLAEAGIGEKELSDVQLAIRSETGEVFFGSPTVFGRHPITHYLSLPGGTWEMGACPNQGWESSATVRLLYLAGATIISLIYLLTFTLARRQAELRETVQDRTRELHLELAARQRAQEKLRQNLGLLQAVIEGTTDAVFVKDLRGRYQMINSAGARFLGKPAETIIGQDDLALYTADTAKAIMEGDRQVMESGQVRTFEERGTAAGITRVYQATKAPWRDELGNITGVVGVSRDITGHKQMEEALRKSEGQLSLILNNVSDSIFAIAVEPPDGFRFISINRSFLTVTGLTENQIIGARVRDVIPEPAQAQVLQHYHEAIRSGRPVRWEETSDYPTGRKVGHVTVVPVFDARGICTQLVGMVHDVTDRSQAEEQIRRLHGDLRRHADELEQRVAERTAELAVARDHAEAADHIKSAFLATMSHELRTPLNSIIGFTGIILEGLAGPLNTEQDKQLGMVQNSARHLLALINDVLDISKIEAGELKVALAPFDLRAAIERSVGTVRPFAETKGLALQMEISPGIGELVGDARRVEQILLNLLNNAVKFTERGGVILTAERVASSAVVRITDTGIGISAENLAKLFQPFQQVENGLSRSHEGTGLGLAISRRLAEMLGGEISVESEPGKGSTFTVSLPEKGAPTQ